MPLPRPRLVATDLDGTLVRHDFTVSDLTVRTLHELRDLGVDIVLVTGRPPRWMPAVVEAIRLDGVALCANGALRYDLGEDRVIAVTPFTTERARDVVQRLRLAYPDAGFALETADGNHRERAYVPRYDTGFLAVREDAVELIDEGLQIVKILCRVPGQRADLLLASAREALGGLCEPVHSNPGDCMLEIGPPGVSKGAALALLAAERGVAADEVVAFGDMPNDVPMLRWAGRGYAMADGDAEAHEAAGRTAPPCAEDGVARVLRELFALD